MIVIDASVMFRALLNDDEIGDKARARIAGERLTAPSLLDLEVVSALRGMVRAGEIYHLRAEIAISDLAASKVRRTPHLHLLDRCWELRHNLSVYDASYVALAELFEVPLVTGDARLAKAPGPQCQIEVLGA